MPDAGVRARSAFNSLNTFVEDIEDVDTSDLGIDLLLARENEEEGYEFTRVEISQEIAEELEELVREKATKYHEAVDEGDALFENYAVENADRERTIIQYEVPEDIPNFGHFGPLKERERFTHSGYRDPPKPEFQAIRISDSDGDVRAIAFLHYRRDQILGRTKRFRMIAGDSSHRKIDNSVMSIPDRVDSILFEDMMFIFNPTKFEKAFNYMRKYEDKTDEVVDTLRESEIKFEDFELFEDAVYGNNRVLRLMYKVHKNGVYEDMDEHDAEYIRENFDTDVEFVEDEDGDMAVHMENKKDIWSVLRFFNDDHLNSPITDEQYISLSKQDAGD